jgi:endonuclease/exonuclease/phosphatase family metal-dependent hydrolase
VCVAAALLGATRVVAVGAEATVGPLPTDGEAVCGEEGSGQPAQLTGNRKLRVGTYNVLHSQGEDETTSVTKRLPMVVKAMAAADADVWGLQEVTNNDEHGRVAEEIARGLAAVTGERWEWCWFLSNPHVPGEPDVDDEDDGGGGPLSDQMAEMSNFPAEGDFREGLAVVTRFDVTAARSWRMAPRSYEAPACIPPDPFACNFAAVFDSRQVQWARIETGPTQGGVDVFNTHLAHGITPLSPATQLLQAREALAIIDLWGSPDDRLPDVFVGDFNATPGSDVYKAIIDAGFVDTYDASGAPACGSIPSSPSTGCTSDVSPHTDAPTQPELNHKIDHVFARAGTCGVRARDAVIFGDQPEFQLAQPPLELTDWWLWASDHLGVRTTIGCAIH